MARKGTKGTLTLEELRKVVNEISDSVCNGSKDASYRTNYSGRGMTGKTCVGFTLSASDLVLLGVVLTSVLGYDRSMDLSASACTDSMGRDTIVYFPGWVLGE